MKKIYIAFLFLLSAVTGSAQVTASWTALTSGTTTNLNGVFAINSSICYVVGNAGTILKTIDGGTSWVPQVSGISQVLYYVFFTDANNGYAVGDNNTAIKTTNGGTTWSAMTVPIVSGVNFRYVYFINSITGFISGGATSGSGKILKTTDAGTTWTSISLTGVSSSAVTSIAFTSSTTGYATEYSGKILKTTDGGNTWSSLTSGTSTNLQEIEFTSANNGFVSGDNGLIKTTSNAGSTWSTVTSGTTTDYLTGIDFYDVSNGVIVGGNVAANTGVILTTTNGGASWSTYNPGSSRLYEVDFVNANLGYAVGLNGTILRYSSNVGIEEQEVKTNNLKSYPNPFSNSTSIDCSNYTFKKSASVEVVDVTGKIVKNIKSALKDGESRIVIEKGNLIPGIYFYKIYDGTSMMGTGKMIVE